MKKISAIVLSMLLFTGCASIKPPARTAEVAFTDRHMKNVTQLTFDGDNGEAYFSWDGKKLIFQSSHGGYGCDKIWTMNIDG